MTGDPVDVLIGDYLAEITLAGLSSRRTGDGWIDYAVQQLIPHLAALAVRGIKVVTSAGGFDPAGMARVLRTTVAERGVTIRVAHVTGDDVSSRVSELVSRKELSHLESSEPLTDWDKQPVAANAYLGGWGIAAALGEGADIVVCGRVTDASLSVGAAAWWHSWSREDFEQLAGAVVAGHIVECGPQAAGGNFSGFTDISGMVLPGFPIAEIAADGSCIITKHAGHDGAVTVDTVTAQLVYEIQGPVYLNPDVTVDLNGVHVDHAGKDRIAVGGAHGSPPSPQTKVAIFGHAGWRVVNTVYVTGPDLDDKVRLLGAQLAIGCPDDVVLDITPLGTPAADPASQWEATVAVRVLAVAKQRDSLEAYDLGGRLGSMYLQSFPGFFHDGAAPLTSRPRPVIDYWPGLLSQTELRHATVLDDGSMISIPPPARTVSASQPAGCDRTPSTAASEGRLVALGLLVHTRSGDKGGNCNVGVWPRDRRAWPWLREALTTADLCRLLPEIEDLDVVRHELPRMYAVNFVIRGLLGTAGSSSMRVDQVAKAVGEYLRAKRVVAPLALLEAIGVAD